MRSEHIERTIHRCTK